MRRGGGGAQEGEGGRKRGGRGERGKEGREGEREGEV